LEPGTIYYARVSSSNGEDETDVNYTAAYATRSESSGAIEPFILPKDANTDLCYFQEEAISLVFCHRRHYCCVHLSALSTPLILLFIISVMWASPTQLNAAYDAGVQVRIVGQGTNTNAAIDNLRCRHSGSSCVKMILAAATTISSMIVDADYVDKAIVLTGSTNWIDQDQFSQILTTSSFSKTSHMARGYRLEFEEMWGSSRSANRMRTTRNSVVKRR
jgi:hypothetical protein